MSASVFGVYYLNKHARDVHQRLLLACRVFMRWHRLLHCYLTASRHTIARTQVRLTVRLRSRGG